MNYRRMKGVCCYCGHYCGGDDFAVLLIMMRLLVVFIVMVVSVLLMVDVDGGVGVC